MNWFQKLKTWAKGRLKLRPGELKVDHKQVLPVGTEEIVNGAVETVIGQPAASPTDTPPGA